MVSKMKKCLGNKYPRYQKKARDGHSLTGFSLLELVLALFIMSIVLVTSMSLTDNLITAQRHAASVTEIERLAHLLVGNPNETQTGHQAGFGYFGVYGDVLLGAASLSELMELDMGPMTLVGGAPQSVDYELDEWGVSYTGAVNGVGMPFYNIESDGPDRTDGTADDIIYRIVRTSYGNWAGTNGNTVRIYIQDAAGNALRSNGGDVGTLRYPILGIRLEGYRGNEFSEWYAGGVPASNRMSAMTYTDGYFEVSNVRAGFYRIAVRAVDGVGGVQTDHNHQDDLLGFDLATSVANGGDNDEVVIRKVIIVYPRGRSIPNGVIQTFIVRLPGVLDQTEVGVN